MRHRVPTASNRSTARSVSAGKQPRNFGRPQVNCQRRLPLPVTPTPRVESSSSTSSTPTGTLPPTTPPMNGPSENPTPLADITNIRTPEPNAAEGSTAIDLAAEARRAWKAFDDILTLLNKERTPNSHTNGTRGRLPTTLTVCNLSLGNLSFFSLKICRFYDFTPSTGRHDVVFNGGVLGRVLK